jgi:hypothetical protein
MRKCNKCDKLFPETTQYFCKCARCRDGLNYTCKSCIKEYQLSIKERLQEYQKEYQVQYKLDNAEHLNEYGKRHQRHKYHNDPEYRARQLEKQRTYNAEKRLKKQNDK